MQRQMKKAVFCATAALMGWLIAPSSTQAAIGGAASCKENERAVIHTKEVYVPSYVGGSKRGDILLTSGGNGVPRELFRAIHQTYNHTMLISDDDDGSGHTLITHDTAISPGLFSLEFNVQPGWGGLQIDVRFKPDHLHRMVPGNAVRDRASTLVHGEDLGCLNRATLAPNAPGIVPNTLADCIDARPINLWAGSNLLLRPKSPILSQQAIIDRAESLSPHSILYAFGAYSDHLGLYNASGVEAAWGQGSMCSGFVAEAVNHALGQNPNTSLGVPPVFYSNTRRFTAAIALHNRIYSDFMTLFDPLINGPWLARALANLVNFDADATATALTNQIVNCFAHGGACDDTSPWTTVDPVTFKNTMPTPPQGGFYLPAQNSLGSGFTLSGDDLLLHATTNNWATVHSAFLGGDYYFDRFDHIQCCQVDPITNATTGNCYRPDLNPREATSAEKLIRDEILPPSSSDDPSTLPTRDGQFVETKDSYCYHTSRGSLCTALPPAVSDPPQDEPAKETNQVSEINQDSVTNLAEVTR